MYLYQSLSILLQVLEWAGPKHPPASIQDDVCQSHLAFTIAEGDRKYQFPSDYLPT
jgi:hypothetical protein